MRDRSPGRDAGVEVKVDVKPRKLKKVLIAALVVFSSVGLVAALGLAQDQGVQTPGMKVERIQIVGNELISTAEILKELPFKEGEWVTEEGIREGGERILKMGYFQRVVPNYNRIDDEIEVIYQVEENPVVEEIEIEGNEQYGKPLWIFGLKIPFTSPILSTERILEILKDSGVEKGKILNANKLSKGLEAILKEYQKKGYTLVRIGDVKIGPKLVIQLIESKIERIEITGVSPELEEIARGLIKLPLGRPVKIRDLQWSVQGINNSIYFEPTGPQDITFSPGSAPDRVVLHWALRERRLLEEPVLIREIRFIGNTVYPQERLLQALGPLPEPKPEHELDNFELLQVLQGVYDLYHRNGYTLADLKSAGVEDGVLTVEVLEGVIDEVVIEGNERTKEYVIRRKLALRPGEVFNEERLRASYVGLQELGYFEEVEIGFEQAAPGRVKLIITITEKKNLGSLNGALTYAKGGLVGKLSLSWKNIFGTGQDISLGYDRGLIGRYHTNWHFDYSTSVFFPSYDFFKISVYHKVEKGEGAGRALIKRVGGELSLGYPLGPGVSLKIADRYERFRKCYEEEEECELPGITNSVTLGLSQDTRDNAIFPTSGGLRNIVLEQAGGFTPGVRFTKLQVSLVEHFPAGKDQALAIRAYSGLGLSLPSQERFILGGVNTIRGYPRSLVDRFFLINGEYRVKLTEGVVGVLFADLGLGTDEAAGMEAGWAVGLEMRVTVPAIGLVRFIFTWPCVDGRMDWAPKFEFGFGPMF